MWMCVYGGRDWPSWYCTLHQYCLTVTYPLATSPQAMMGVRNELRRVGPPKFIVSLVAAECCKRCGMSSEDMILTQILR